MKQLPSLFRGQAERMARLLGGHGRDGLGLFNGAPVGSVRSNTFSLGNDLDSTVPGLVLPPSSLTNLVGCRRSNVSQFLCQSVLKRFRIAWRAPLRLTVITHHNKLPCRNTLHCNKLPLATNWALTKRILFHTSFQVRSCSPSASAVFHRKDNQ
jgi:hypothetical protein